MRRSIPGGARARAARAALVASGLACAAAGCRSGEGSTADPATSAARADAGGPAFPGGDRAGTDAAPDGFSGVSTSVDVTLGGDAVRSGIVDVTELDLPRAPDGGAGDAVWSVAWSFAEGPALDVACAAVPAAMPLPASGCALVDCSRSRFRWEWADPGALGIAGLAAPFSTETTSGGWTSDPVTPGTGSARGSGAPWTAGDALTFTGAGRDVPAFTTSAPAPGTIALVAPTIESDDAAAPLLVVDRGRDLEVAWTAPGAAGAGTVRVRLESTSSVTPIVLACVAPIADGRLTVPRTKLVELPSSADVAFVVDVVSEATTTVGAWSVTGRATRQATSASVVLGAP